jgi:asparagine synthase (glutamine-hydrolysing)
VRSWRRVGALFGFWGPPDRTLLERMAAALRHRGRGTPVLVEQPWGSLGFDAPPDDVPRVGTLAGAWEDGATAFALCGDPRDSAGSPMRADDRSPTHARAELARAWREQGTAALAGVHGSWVAAILEPRRLVLARDHVGERSLSWTRMGSRVLFASEPKGLWSLPGFTRRPSLPALAQYLAYSFVPGPTTMLADVFALRCGCALSFDGGDPSEHRFFDFESIATDDAVDEQEWAERFRAVCGEAVAVRLPARGDVGLFLSGGLDSSVIAAELVRRAPARVHSFSIHFGPKRPSELPFARAVAERCGTEHHEIELRPRDFLPRFREVAWHLDDPIGDPITVPNFELSRRVAAITRHVFNGEGGDPLYGGPKNLPMMLAHWYGGVDHGPGSRERTYVASFRRAHDELDRLLTPEARREIDVERDLVAPLTPLLHAERPPTLLGKLQAANIRLKGAHLILPKVERMTAAAGLAIQSPLFDPRLVELSFAMPGRMKLRDGVEKWVMKQAYADALPDAVTWRPKSGMRVPVHDWFLGEMRGFARELLAPRRLRANGLWSPERVKQILAYDREQPGGRYGLKLWMLLAFETWRSLVVDGESP